MKTRKRALWALVITAFLTFGSTGVASAIYSVHGDDQSNDYDTSYGVKTGLRNCDRESDSNKTKGGWAITPSGGESGSVTDGDGNNGICATSAQHERIYRHHTCEKNLLSWDCGNWAAT